MDRLELHASHLTKRQRRRIRMAFKPTPKRSKLPVIVGVMIGVAYVASDLNGELIARDDVAQTTEGVGVWADVLANDAVGHGVSLKWARLTGGGGWVEIRGKGLFYHPDGAFAPLWAGATAQQKIVYFVEDDRGRRAKAQLTITIEGKNSDPVARDDEGRTAASEPLTVDVLANDYDPDEGDRLRIVKLQQAPGSRGSAEIRGASIYFDPGAEFDDLGVDQSNQQTLTYVIEDDQEIRARAVITITIVGENGDEGENDNEGENDPPVAPPGPEVPGKRGDPGETTPRWPPFLVIPSSVGPSNDEHSSIDPPLPRERCSWSRMRTRALLIGRETGEMFIPECMWDVEPIFSIPRQLPVSPE